jgi:2-hydroxychromene-2-carboxylate isomerase
MSREIEFWFEFGSNYSYLSVMRIEDAAARHGTTIAWKPFLLGPIFKSFGWESSPFVAQKEKGEYVMKDMARQCRKYGLPWTRPTTFPRIALLPMRVALIGAGESWMAEYSRRIMLLNFSQDQEINTEEAVGKVLASLDLPAPDLLREAQTERNKLRLRSRPRPPGRGHLGAPTFFVRGEMFWGNDRWTTRSRSRRAREVQGIF